jgi:hypothetical protein
LVLPLELRLVCRSRTPRLAVGLEWAPGTVGCGIFHTPAVQYFAARWPPLLYTGSIDETRTHSKASHNELATNDRRTIMIDPTTIRLNETLYRQRLQAAAEARRRATWVADPSPIERLQQAIGNRLVSLGQWMQVSAARADVHR